MNDAENNPNDELADAIESLRAATGQRELAMPGSREYEDALTTETLLNSLVLDLVRERNRTGAPKGAAPWPSIRRKPGRRS
jgi:hypothetical protein